MKNLFKRFVKEESGATMVEYAIMVALVAVVGIVGVTFVGDEVGKAFNNVGTTISGTGTADSGTTDTGTTTP